MNKTLKGFFLVSQKTFIIVLCLFSYVFAQAKNLNLSLPDEALNLNIEKTEYDPTASIVHKSNPHNVNSRLEKNHKTNSPLLKITISDQTCLYARINDKNLVKAFCKEYSLQPVNQNSVYVPNFSAYHPDQYEKAIAEFFPMAEHKRERENLFYMQGLAVMFIMAFAQLPESITQWDHKDLNKSIFERWKENVKKGPVKDGDDWTMNYAAHPTVGSWYYSLGRKNGMSPTEAFIYAAFLSTLWEYTTEATQEPPSIQDLIITPVVGSLLGEVSYQLLLKIEENDDRVLGSSLLGKTLKTLLNPTIPATNLFRNSLNGLIKVHDVKFEIFYGVQTGPLSERHYNPESFNSGPALGGRFKMLFDL